jgi:hypothetical protein
LPPSSPSGPRRSYLEEKTYGNLLGRLGETPTVFVECLFVDPVSDIAVLGSPDDQALGNEADAYEELLEPIKPLAISDTKEKRVAPGSSRWSANGFRVPMKSLTAVRFGFLAKKKGTWRHVRLARLAGNRKGYRSRESRESRWP